MLSAFRITSIQLVIYDNFLTFNKNLLPGSFHNSYFSSASNTNAKMAWEVQNVLRKTDAVCFDVDSTVIQEEGIDELAAFCNKGSEVANL